MIWNAKKNKYIPTILFRYDVIKSFFSLIVNYLIKKKLYSFQTIGIKIERIIIKLTVLNRLLIFQCVQE